jgi:hypothetical protein
VGKCARPEGADDHVSRFEVVIVSQNFAQIESAVRINVKIGVMMLELLDREGWRTQGVTLDASLTTRLSPGSFCSSAVGFRALSGSRDSMYGGTRRIDGGRKLQHSGLREDANDGSEIQAMYVRSTLQRERCDAARAEKYSPEFRHLVLEKME